MAWLWEGALRMTILAEILTGKRFEYQTYEVFIIQSPPAVFHDLIATAKIMAYANSF